LVCPALAQPVHDRLARALTGLTRRRVSPLDLGDVLVPLTSLLPYRCYLDHSSLRCSTQRWSLFSEGSRDWGVEPAGGAPLGAEGDSCSNGCAHAGHVRISALFRSTSAPRYPSRLIWSPFRLAVRRSSAIAPSRHLGAVRRSETHSLLVLYTREQRLDEILTNSVGGAILAQLRRLGVEQTRLRHIPIPAE